MNYKVIALAAAALSVAALPNTAEARCHGCGVAAGVVGGLAAGAIIGSAIAGPRYYDAPPAYYAPQPYYGGPAYVEEPVCHTERRRFWDGYGWRSRRVEVCD
ncbi:MAG: hypothetical protein WC670_08715 [Pseudolabrys sp.]|jgi:hypothetical protein